MKHWTDDDWRERFEERAAIMEYDGGFPREEAERLAREYVGRLYREVKGVKHEKHNATGD
jgi:hypothetical protein